MNRFKLCTTVTTILLCTTMNNYTNTSKFYGSAHLTNQNYTDLEVNGSAHLTNVTVANSTTMRGSAHLTNFTCPQLTVKGSLYCNIVNSKRADIFGSFQCVRCTFDVLTVRGSCMLDAVKINNKLSVQGALIATDLECPAVEVKARKVKLKNARVQNMRVEKNENTYHGFFNLWGLLSWGIHEPKATKLYLDGGSVGSITFQELPGRVILTNGAQVGTVTNGTIESR